MYQESDPSDAEDLYGRSKYLGEVQGKNCLTLRTSIIGRELRTNYGLVEWFLQQGNTRIQGYKKAFYTGLTTIELARVIQSVIETRPQLTGLYHVSSDMINKYDLLCLLREFFSLATEITPIEKPKIDRSLDSTKFREEMNYSPPNWSEMIEEMVLDRTPYSWEAR
jgi:dTDP-4-dehydrorhamnose reductase